MKTVFKKVSDIIENSEYCPIPLEIIPNNMGINLCSVEAVSWQKQEDGQLVNVSIYFNPSQQKDSADSPPPCMFCSGKEFHKKECSSHGRICR